MPSSGEDRRQQKTKVTPIEKKPKVEKKLLKVAPSPSIDLEEVKNDLAGQKEVAPPFWFFRPRRLLYSQSEPDTWTGLIFSAPLFVMLEPMKPSKVRLFMYGMLFGPTDT